MTWLKVASGIISVSLLSAAPAAMAQVFPNQAHANYNFIPLGINNGPITYHQVYAAAQFGTDPVEIRSLGFAPSPGVNGQTVVYSELVISLGYTDRSPGGLSANLPDNPRGSLTQVLSAPGFSQQLQSGGTEDFSLIFRFDTPWCYDPNEGNLLIEIRATNSTVDVSTSRCAGVPDASRAWNSPRFGNNADGVAQRMLFELAPCSGGGVTLRLGGSCPGPVSVNWDGATPNTQMGIVFASNSGSLVVPTGPCQGTTLGLGSSNIQLVNTVNTGSGSGSVNGNAGPGACGGFVQLVVVDGSPCTTSNVVQLQ